MVGSLDVGGLEHFVLRIAAAQRATGHKTTILAIHGGPLEAEARRMGLPLTILGGTHKLARVARCMFELARRQPDVVHVHNQASLRYATLSKRVSRARVVMTNHGQGHGVARPPSEQEWQDTDAIVTVSDAVAQRMDLNRLGSKISTIYNGVSFAPARRTRPDVRAELGLGEDRFTGIIVARIDGRKGHDTLLHALAVLRSMHTAVTVLVAGDGKERGKIESLAGELNLDASTIRFLGFRNDVPDLLAASDFFVLPSLTEGLPLSVLEAMTHRLPTVATAVGGIPELVTSGQHGLLVPVGEPDALARAIATLACDASLRYTLGGAALTRVEREFTFERMTRAYDELYFRLHGGELS
jgi:glycosyltransferase involved in cell wall biosynthesis